jgi:hypothetical protein
MARPLVSAGDGGEGAGCDAAGGALIVPADNRLPRSELMKSAGRLMYAAKNSGKNAVTIRTALSPATTMRQVIPPAIVTPVLTAS